MSAGGSAFFDLVVDRLRPSGGVADRVLVRSGRYVAHDCGRERAGVAVRRPRAGAPIPRRDRGMGGRAVTPRARSRDRRTSGGATFRSTRACRRRSRCGADPVNGSASQVIMVVERLNDQHAYLPGRSEPPHRAGRPRGMRRVPSLHRVRQVAGDPRARRRRHRDRRRRDLLLSENPLAARPPHRRPWRPPRRRSGLPRGAPPGRPRRAGARGGIRRRTRRPRRPGRRPRRAPAPPRANDPRDRALRRPTSHPSPRSREVRRRANGSSQLLGSSVHPRTREARRRRRGRDRTNRAEARSRSTVRSEPHRPWRRFRSRTRIPRARRNSSRMARPGSGPSSGVMPVAKTARASSTGTSSRSTGERAPAAEPVR